MPVLIQNQIDVPVQTDQTDEERPYVAPYIQRPSLRVGDQVYLLKTSGGSVSRRGPYLIASVHSPGRFTICSGDGRAVENGQQIEMTRLEAA
ncbi:hypothetical protein F4860DRAFT_523849 [Xylaria cubensis]|nr:hypothetical protein F4860DRAFT_523849 [Xylaria cubensis]